MLLIAKCFASHIVEAIPKIIDGIITAVIDAIPLIIEAGIKLLVSLIQALPQIITTNFQNRQRSCGCYPRQPG